MMYGLSKDYLSRLLESSGVRIGTAKHTAMVAIIELLDQNSLDGLLASIKEDYKAMQLEIADATLLAEKIKVLNKDFDRARKNVLEAGAELTRLLNEKAMVKAEIAEMKREALITGCRPEEESRVRAYKAAIEIGLDAVGYPRSGATYEQVLRSASNVAANWLGNKEAGGDT